MFLYFFVAGGGSDERQVDHRSPGAPPAIKVT
ncbi:hypothetical protein PDIG_70960 [Penicillium digitatum PHI26]|uniref:Uncharacterized protein n=2 Tax=Penicillium digitatum TaxID=36651 RepID=K9FF05_PEND2|nr:hypothetical protein PDIP_80280 [Penicillium digitatum Pd1]EKV06283.1 hypothetical protein PDIP_80280 [Penicillium digitatum Pd1]EKV08020.1 hypothetical protein PDIG_70960 [Penicillium digitatum PHI26]